MVDSKLTSPKASDTKTLYQEVILDHNRKPRNYGVLEGATHKAEGHNPLCGDHLSVSLNLDGERIDAIAFQGESCAICKASASMMTATVKGKTRGDAETLIQEFRDMATGALDPASQPHHLGAAHGICRRARSADARQMRDPALAHAARGVQLGRQHVDRGRRRSDACADRRRLNQRHHAENSRNRRHAQSERDEVHPQGAVDLGNTRSYDNAGQAQDDPLAAALFDIEHVTNVFYVDHWITVTQDGGADWHELQRKLAEPIRAAPAADEQSAAAAAAATTDLADLSPADQQRLDKINELLDEQIRPYLQGDGGDLYVIGLEGNKLTVHYQGACGSCPSSMSGTLAGIENLVKSIEPDIQVVAV